MARREAATHTLQRLDDVAEEGERERETEEGELSRTELLHELAEVQEEAQGLAHFVRFIDDGISIGNAHFDKQKAYYPDCLKLSVSSSNTDGRLVVFMDLNLRQNDAYPYNIVTTLYDKRRSMAYANVPKIYYTHGTTFLAQFQIGTNTVSSQYHRFRRIINDSDNFVLECAIMLTKLVTVCKIPVAPLIHKLKSMLTRFPYRHGTSTTRPTTPYGNYQSITVLFNAAAKQSNPIDWLVQQSPQMIEEREAQKTEQTERRRRMN